MPVFSMYGSKESQFRIEGGGSIFGMFRGFSGFFTASFTASYSSFNGSF